MHPVVCSAYRTHATQVRLHNNKIARLRSAGYSYERAVKEAGRWVAVPGTSEHETGLALDIMSYSYQVLDEKQENTAEQKWFMEHCWEYGFILRYPKDKTEITGIGYEPWHYRYVGREAAAEMKELGLCLEEYIQTLENPVPAEQEQPEALAEEMNQEAAVAAS
jgi:D-alanyl-D-alanine carboxypeptidase